MKRTEDGVSTSNDFFCEYTRCASFLRFFLIEFFVTVGCIQSRGCERCQGTLTVED
jgi:hypothetical protein